MIEVFALIGGLLAVVCGIAVVMLSMLAKDTAPQMRAMAADHLAAGKAQLEAERNQLEAERQRDEAVVEAAAAQAALDRAIEQLKDTQADALRARAELGRQLQERLPNASAEDVMAEVAALLGKPFAVLKGDG